MNAIPFVRCLTLPDVLSSIMTHPKQRRFYPSMFPMMEWPQTGEQMGKAVEKFAKNVRPEVGPFVKVQGDAVVYQPVEDADALACIQAISKKTGGRPPTVYEAILPNVHKLHKQLVTLALSGHVLVVETKRNAYKACRYGLDRTRNMHVLAWADKALRRRVRSEMLGVGVLHGPSTPVEDNDDLVVMYVRVQKVSKAKRAYTHNSTRASHVCVPGGTTLVLAWSSTGVDGVVAKGMTPCMVLDDRFRVCSADSTQLPVHARKDDGAMIGVRTFKGIVPAQKLRAVPEDIQHEHAMHASDELWMAVCVASSEKVVSVAAASSSLSCRVATIQLRTGGMLSDADFKARQEAEAQRRRDAATRRAAALTASLQREAGLSCPDESKDADGNASTEVDEEEMERHRKEHKKMMLQLFCAVHPGAPTQGDAHKVYVGNLNTIMPECGGRPFRGVRRKKAQTVRSRLMTALQRMERTTSAKTWHRTAQHRMATGKG